MKLLLTVDVEPNYTTGTADPHGHLKDDFKRFLDYLKENGIPAILFVCGVIARNFRDMLTDFTDSLDIGVHTHPRLHPEYRNVDKLNFYPADQQLQMIKRDYDMIYQNLGVKPIAFRAGKLAADATTISLLKSLDIKMDSSLLVPYIFRLHAIRYKPWRARKHDGMIRIPIIAADKRVIEIGFKMKASFINFLDRETICCIMFHSWWLNESNLNSLTKTLFKYEFAELEDFLKGD